MEKRALDVKLLLIILEIYYSSKKYIRDLFLKYFDPPILSRTLFKALTNKVQVILS